MTVGCGMLKRCRARMTMSRDRAKAEARARQVCTPVIGIASEGSEGSEVSDSKWSTHGSAGFPCPPTDSHACRRCAWSSAVCARPPPAPGGGESRGSNVVVRAPQHRARSRVLSHERRSTVPTISCRPVFTHTHMYRPDAGDGASPTRNPVDT